MSDPSSWLALDTGTPVYASDGEEVGSVAEVLGDEQNDIFNGLTVRANVLGSARYVPAEHVAQIYEDRVDLDLTGAELAELDEHGPQDR